MTTPQPPRPPLSAATLRYLWRKWKFQSRTKSITVAMWPPSAYIRRVADVAGEAWFLFGKVLQSYDYDLRKLSTWVNKYISGTTIPSSHGYGTAADINFYLDGLNGFNYGWSWNKTDFTPEQVSALLAIRTISGHQVFAWGGSWRTKQDYMHWYIACGPKHLATGIDLSTIEYGEEETMKYFLAIFNLWTVEDLQAMKDAGYWDGNPAWYFLPTTTDAAKVNLVVHVLANGNKDIPPSQAKTTLS